MSGSLSYQNFEQITCHRLLCEMFESARKEGCTAECTTPGVLILDRFTMKIMSHVCKKTDITTRGFPLQEDISRRRERFPSTDAVYFIQPSKDNVAILLADMGRVSLYRKAFVFFSSPISQQLLNFLKGHNIVPRISLKEINLEYFAVDSQVFVTGNETAFEDLFRDNIEDNRNGEECLKVMAARIATVFASLKEFPLIRYRAAKSINATNSVTTFCDLITTKLAAGVWNCLIQYKQRICTFPQTETCELLILDRSIDQIAPIIHEWFYDAMCHDLLNLDGDKYVFEAYNKIDSSLEKKENFLNKYDPIWLELRHAHIADVNERLHEKMKTFISKNKAAQMHLSRRENGGELSTSELHRLVQALPQYAEQKDKLSVHVEIVEKINSSIKDLSLKEFGKLEQDLVFGDAGINDVLKYLKTNENAAYENKFRLLIILGSIYPEKLEGEEGAQLTKVAKLPMEDISVIKNLRQLGGYPDSVKSSSAGFSLKFDFGKDKRIDRKRRKDLDETWQLSSFYPIVEELVEKLSEGALSEIDYPCLNDRIASSHGSSKLSAVHGTPAAVSRRTPTWARKQNLDNGNLSKMGRRIFVFIVGGATRSEIRAIHKVTKKLGREVVLGSSSIIDPPHFIKVTSSLFHFPTKFPDSLSNDVLIA